MIDKSAAQMADALSKGEITSVELTEAHLDRISAVDSQVKAFLHVDTEGALAQAKDVDARRKSGEKLSPIAGVPLALKDVLAQKGVPTTSGSKILQGWRPPAGMLDKNGQPIEDRIYNLKDMDRHLVLEGRTQVVAEKVTAYLKATDPFQKTIIFCDDIDHAERMRQAIVNLNPDLSTKAVPVRSLAATTSVTAASASVTGAVSAGSLSAGSVSVSGATSTGSLAVGGTANAVNINVSQVVTSNTNISEAGLRDVGDRKSTRLNSSH